MNNFVFSQDPLLYSTTIPQHNNISEADIKRQLDTVMAQYQALQQLPPKLESTIEDHLGSLDNMVRNLDVSVIESLNSNPEFIELNNWIQQAIQNEIMKNVKTKLNASPDVISKVNRAKEIIQELKTTQENEDRRSLSELNDYITNYSDMTFNEYKQLKLSKQT